MQDYIDQVKDSVQQEIYTPAFGSITGDIVQSKMFEILDAIKAIVGDSYTDLQEPISDILLDIINTPAIEGGMQFLGEFETYQQAIAGINSFDNGDVFVVISTGLPKITSTYMYLSDWTLIAQVKEGGTNISGLRVIKRSINTQPYIQTNDFAEGWVDNDLFINGFWIRSDNPGQAELQDKDNWSAKTNF